MDRKIAKVILFSLFLLGLLSQLSLFRDTLKEEFLQARNGQAKSLTSAFERLTNNSHPKLHKLVSQEKIRFNPQGNPDSNYAFHLLESYEELAGREDPALLAKWISQKKQLIQKQGFSLLKGSLRNAFLTFSRDFDILATRQLTIIDYPPLALPRISGLTIFLTTGLLHILLPSVVFQGVIILIFFLFCINSSPVLGVVFFALSTTMLAVFTLAKERVEVPLNLLEGVCWIFIFPIIFGLAPEILFFTLTLLFISSLRSRDLSAFAFKRTIQTLPVLLGVSTVTFMMMFVVPGDPARLLFGNNATAEQIARERERLGLTKPIPIQLLNYYQRLLQGDLGQSYKTRKPVLKIILQAAPATLLLTYFSLVIAIFLGTSAGIISAIKHNSLIDKAATIITLFGISMPVFWFGYLLQKYIGMNLNFIPIQGYEEGISRFLILPAFTLATIPMAMIARLTRASMLEIINQDYIRTARAKGLHEAYVILKHSLRNAIIPVATYIGGSIASLMSGAILTETIFSWPGIGRLALDRIMARDFPVIQGTVLFAALVFVLCNLLVDISYALLDPRVRYES